MLSGITGKAASENERGGGNHIDACIRFRLKDTLYFVSTCVVVLVLMVNAIWRAFKALC